MATLYDLDDLTRITREHALTLGTLCDMVLGEAAEDRSDKTLIRAVGEMRNVLKALHVWCDENLNGSPAGYHEIMCRADEVLKKAAG
jgi:hypothetical protein